MTRPWDGDGVGQLDEPDLHLDPLAVQLAFEVLPGAAPPVGEVVLDPVRTKHTLRATSTTR